MTVLKLPNYLKVNQIDILIDVESMLSIYAIPAVVGLICIIFVGNILITMWI